METASKYSPNIFLCHSSDDKPLVRGLYTSLKNDKFNVWLDEENILPGQDWEMEITKAVRNADIVIICLSKGSINKSGYIQKEIRSVLSVAEEKPDGVIFIIPARLEECEVPHRLRKWQWVDLFNPDGYRKLLRSLQENLLRQGQTVEYSKEIGTRIQSGLPSMTEPKDFLPSLYIPLAQEEAEVDHRLPQQLTITIRATGNKEYDKRRIKAIFGTLISFHGRDQFSFQIYENGKGHLIDFPNDTTRVCEELLTRLKKLIGVDNAFRLEEIVFD